MNFVMSRQLRQNEEFLPAYREVPVTADYKMVVTDTMLKVNSSSAAITITLPPVAEVGGADYLIKMVGTTPFIVTIVDRGDSIAWSNRTLTTATGVIVLASDGEQWYVILTVG